MCGRRGLPSELPTGIHKAVERLLIVEYKYDLELLDPALTEGSYRRFSVFPFVKGDRNIIRKVYMRFRLLEGHCSFAHRHIESPKVGTRLAK